jgi:L-ribulose-5-phosphate 3-epimerase UlaE
LCLLEEGFIFIMPIEITKSLEEGERLLRHDEGNEQRLQLGTAIKNHRCRIKLMLCLPARERMLSASEDYL